MSRYTSATDADRAAMLERIGVQSIDDLFETIPEGVRLGRALDLPPGRPEQEVYAHLRELASRNVSTDDELSFLGAGMYDHYVPALVDSIIGRSEFLTPYTEVESVKAVSDVIAPLSGEIVEVNEGLSDSPENVNEDPYGEGWLVKIRLSEPSEADDLMDASTYEGSLS